MNDATVIPNNQGERDDMERILFSKYTSALRQFHDAPGLESGIAAGKAWAAWLQVFVAPNNHSSDETTVS
jgi:hypothetical protein